MLHGHFFTRNMHLIQNSHNISVSSPEEIGNVLAKTWSEYTKNSNFGTEYVNNKNRYVNSVSPNYNIKQETKSIELPFSTLERNACLSTLKGKTP